MGGAFRTFGRYQKSRSSNRLVCIGGHPNINNTWEIDMLRQYILLQTMLRNRRDERGATAVEYGLMVALIAVAIIVTVGLLGEGLDGLFATVLAEVDGAPAAP